MATSESLTMAKQSAEASQHVSASAVSLIASLHLPSFEWYASVPDIERMAIVMALFGTGAVVRSPTDMLSTSNMSSAKCRVSLYI